MGVVVGGVVSTWVRPPGGAARRPDACGSAEGSATELAPPPVAPSRGYGGRLGRYVLIERVGTGRQADVWRALHTGPSAGEVALKVLAASASRRDPRRRVQLRREAERGARLAVPSLLPAYEFGEDDGAAFMAMPLVDGCTLASVVVQRRNLRAGWPPPEGGFHRLAAAGVAAYTRAVVGLVARVARAAGGAHDGRVAHRDIKPGNVLIDRSFNPGRPGRDAGVYLCDFGLGRDLDVATPVQLRDGAGSPLYMAPERLLRRAADEVRADVYSLGVTLCEALTLATPRAVPDGLPRAAWMAYLAAVEPRRPSALWPSIPFALEAAIHKATARNPARRYQSAARFAEALEAYLADTSPR